MTGAQSYTVTIVTQDEHAQDITPNFSPSYLLLSNYPHPRNRTTIYADPWEITMTPQSHKDMHAVGRASLIKFASKEYPESVHLSSQPSPI